MVSSTPPSLQARTCLRLQPSRPPATAHLRRPTTAAARAAEMRIVCLVASVDYGQVELVLSPKLAAGFVKEDAPRHAERPAARSWAEGAAAEATGRRGPHLGAPSRMPSARRKLKRGSTRELIVKDADPARRIYVRS